MRTSEFDHRAAAGVADPALARLLTDHWETAMRRSPVWASRLGDRRFDDLLSPTRPEDHEAERERTAALLARARAIDAGSLDEGDRLTLALLRESLETSDAEGRFRAEEWTLNPRSNAVTLLGWLPEVRPVEGPEDEAALLARYRGIAAYVDGEIETLRRGLATGRVSNAESARRFVNMVRAELARPTEEWAAATGAEAASVLDAHARPAFARYADFVEREILPAAREGENVGLSGLPEGPDLYPALIRRFTTLPLTADEVFAVGEEDLARIHEEFAKVGERALGTRDVPAIFARLRTDPALFFRTAEEVERVAADALAAARAAIPAFFGRLPEADCVVVRIPDHEAPFTTVAYYRPPSGEGAPGEYRINVYAPETRPRPEARALACHESIPGHHLQIAIARELPEMPAFRRHAGFTAYVEGWALYTERLAEEMGLYEDDLDRLGMLSFDAWRAARLVVDAGLHHRGWSRERAERFLLENTPLAPNNIGNEVDRYLCWPGQALAYKIGQREMWRLRREAEARLGPAFDLRAFHDAVLTGGAMTLPLLAERLGRTPGFARGPLPEGGPVTRYQYYLVEGTYLVRRHDRGAEFLKPDGSWHPYPDLWDVATNGRYLCDDEGTAMARARRLFEEPTDGPS